MNRKDRVHLEVGPLVFSLALALVAVLWSVFVYRPVSHFWSLTFLSMLNGEVYYEPLRQVNALPQVPAFLLAKLAGSADWTREILLLWSLSFSLQPIVSLIASWAICARARVPQAFLFPLLSFATATSMILGVVCAEVVTTISVFWPLFLLQWIGKKGSYRTAGIFLGSLALVLTHELASLSFGVLAITAWVRKKEQQDRGHETVFAILYSTAALGLVAHGLSLSESKHYMFRKSALEPWGPAGWAAVVAAGAFVAAVASESSRKFRGKAVWILSCGWVASVLAYAFVAYRVPSTFASIDTSFYLRVTAPPLASLIALAALGVHRIQGRPWAALSWFTAAVLMQASVSDLAMTRRWTAGVANLKKIVAAQDRPCSLISDVEYASSNLPKDPSREPLDMFYVALPTLSILTQNTRRPAAVVGLKSWTEKHLRIDFCQEILKGNLPAFPAEPLPLNGRGYLDYSKLTRELKK